MTRKISNVALCQNITTLHIWKTWESQDAITMSKHHAV